MDWEEAKVFKEKKNLKGKKGRKKEEKGCNQIMQFIYLAEAMLVLLLSFEILSDLNNCNSPESAALEGIFKAG